MTVTKFLLLIALVGHLLCWDCDRLITYAPGGRFSMDALKENAKMQKMYTGMPLKRMEISMLLGVAAMTMEMFGYLAIAKWMERFSAAYAAIFFAATVIAFISGVVHHVTCGAVEWLYVKLGCTEQAREAIFEFFKKTSLPTMLVCFASLLVFSVVLFAAVVTGGTSLPRWACIFNLLVVFVVMAPFRIVGTFNLAGAGMFLGLLLFV